MQTLEQKQERNLVRERIAELEAELKTLRRELVISTTEFVEMLEQNWNNFYAHNPLSSRLIWKVRDWFVREGYFTDKEFDEQLYLASQLHLPYDESRVQLRPGSPIDDKWKGFISPGNHRYRWMSLDWK